MVGVDIDTAAALLACGVCWVVPIVAYCVIRTRVKCRAGVCASEAALVAAEASDDEDEADSQHQVWRRVEEVCLSTRYRT